MQGIFVLINGKQSELNHSINVLRWPSLLHNFFVIFQVAGDIQKKLLSGIQSGCFFVQCPLRQL
jgi:acyl-ACP thioesterase